MVAADEDDLICDFAEVYHIFDWRKLPVRLASTLAAGLPNNSRSMRALVKMPCSMDTLLMAAVADRLSVLVWMKTKDGRKGRNKPKMITEELLKNREEKEIESFTDIDAFEAARRRFFKE